MHGCFCCEIPGSSTLLCLLSASFDEPLPLLYNNGAVLIGLVYTYLPFVVLPLFATLERMDKNLLEAAADLGAASAGNSDARSHSSVRAGVSSGSGAGVHPLPGRISHAGSSGRRQDGDGGKSDPESVHDSSRLALWFGCVVGFDGDCARAVASQHADTKRGPAVKNGRALSLYAVLAFAFLHLPLIVLAVFSVNNRDSRIWQGFSFRWYEAVVQDPQLAEAAWNSLVIAVASTSYFDMSGDDVRIRPLETQIHPNQWQSVYDACHARDCHGRLSTRVFPMDVPVSARAAWNAYRCPRARHVLDRLCRDRDHGAAAGSRPPLEEAALDLGGSEWDAFRLVTLPQLGPAIISAALLAFTISFDDYVITSMVAGVDSETLPMVIYAMARRGANPVVNAISTMIVVGSGRT